MKEGACKKKKKKINKIKLKRQLDVDVDSRPDNGWCNQQPQKQEHNGRQQCTVKDGDAPSPFPLGYRVDRFSNLLAWP